METTSSGSVVRPCRPGAAEKKGWLLAWLLEMKHLEMIHMEIYIVSILWISARGHDQHLSYLTTLPKCDLKQLQDLQGNEECQWCQLLHWSERRPWHDWDLELQVTPPCWLSPVTTVPKINSQRTLCQINRPWIQKRKKTAPYTKNCHSPQLKSKRILSLSPIDVLS